MGNEESRPCKPVAIIGDMHGEYEPVCRLLDILHAQGVRQIVSVGDLVHKTTVSKQLAVIRAVAALQWRESSQWPGLSLDIVGGNHDAMLLETWQRFDAARAANDLDAENAIRVSDAQRAARGNGSLELIRILEDDDPDYKMVFEGMYASMTIAGHRDPVHGLPYMVVHAGLLPDMWLPGASALSVPSAPISSLTRAERKAHASMSRVRWVEPTNKPKYPSGWKMASVGAETVVAPEMRRWWDLYDADAAHGFGRVLVVGHEPVRQVTENTCKTVTAIDTGACKDGGHLTAMVLRDGEVPNFISVPTDGRGKWYVG